MAEEAGLSCAYRVANLTMLTLILINTLLSGTHAVPCITVPVADQLNRLGHACISMALHARTIKATPENINQESIACKGTTAGLHSVQICTT